MSTVKSESIYRGLRGFTVRAIGEDFERENDILVIEFGTVIGFPRGFAVAVIVPEERAIATMVYL